ncbi:hypothetical protein P9112_004099 [Eukaryota sp. TZLM1-RC]
MGKKHRRSTKKHQKQYKTSTTRCFTSGEPGKRGLRSSGLSCFFNAVLQSLFALPELDTFLTCGSTINSALHRLYIQYWDTSSPSILSPLSLYDHIARKFPVFSDYGQHDAFELLMALTCAVETEQAESDGPKFKSLFSFTSISKITCMSCETVTTKKEVFYNYSLSLLSSPKRNRRGKPGLSPNPNINLESLSISPPSPFRSSQENPDLVELLRFFCHPECLYGDNAFICRICTSRERKRQAKKILECQDSSLDLKHKAEIELKQSLPFSNDSDDEFAPRVPRKKLRKRPAIKQFYFPFNLPIVLIFHIKRFKASGFGFEKDSTFVEFPLVLNSRDFSDFTPDSDSNSDEERVDYNFQLQAVVSHSGCLDFGHYVAYTRLGDSDTWHYFSDENYKQVDQNLVLNSEAYILFYKKT